jgi:hypothetical protein
MVRPFFIFKYGENQVFAMKEICNRCTYPFSILEFKSFI